MFSFTTNSILQEILVLPNGNLFTQLNSRAGRYVHVSTFNTTDNTSIHMRTWDTSEAYFLSTYSTAASATDAGIVHITGKYALGGSFQHLLYFVIDSSDMSLVRNVLRGDVPCSVAYSSVAVGDYVISSIQSNAQSRDFIIIYDTTDDSMESYAVPERSRLKHVMYRGSGNIIDVFGISADDKIIYSEIDLAYIADHPDLDASASIVFSDVADNYTYGASSDHFAYEDTYSTTSLTLIGYSADQGISKDTDLTLYSGVFYGDTTTYVASVTQNNTGVELTYDVLSCSNFDLVTVTYQLQDTGTYAAPSWVTLDSANGKLLVDTPVEATDTLYEFDVLTYFDDDTTAYEQRVNLTVEVCDDSNCSRCEPLDSSVCLD